MSQNTEEISKVHSILRESKILSPARFVYARGLEIKRFGWAYEWWKCINGIRNRYAKGRYWRSLLLSEQERENQKNHQFADAHIFSILVPLYNTPEDFLREMIESVQKQTYGKWQLCLADGSDEQHQIVRQIVQEYATHDSRISYQKLEHNGGISENTNACMDMAEGDYIVLFDHDDLLHEAALYEIQRAIEEKQADFIYTDEAIFSSSPVKPDSYHFKPDFALDDLRSNNYICHISCFSKELLSQAGRFRKEYDGSQDFDLILRLTEKAKHIVHIPKVLYYWRCHELSVASDISAKTYCIDAGKMAVQSHMERMNVQATVESSEVYPVIYRIHYPIQGSPKVTIITNHAITVPQIGNVSVEVLIYSDIKDRASLAKKASGEYLLFLHDVVPSGDNWLEELLGTCQREEVGAAGGKVDYNNDTIRDVGIILGLGKRSVAGNALFRVNADNMGFMGNMHFLHNVSALSDNYLMISKKVFEQIGGLTEELPEWFAGIDLSLKLKETGKWLVVNPYAGAVYQQKEHKRDIAGGWRDKENAYQYLLQRWGDVLKQPDPYYNENLTSMTADYAIGRKGQ